jgi:hypothetical protein
MYMVELFLAFFGIIIIVMCTIVRKVSLRAQQAKKYMTSTGVAARVRSMSSTVGKSAHAARLRCELEATKKLPANVVDFIYGEYHS